MIGIIKSRAVAILSSTLIKAQVSSLIATGVDWFLTFSLTHWLGTWYVISSILGATAGGGTNFMLNRNWTFNAEDFEKNPIITGQFIRYVLVWSCSIILNTSGTIILTEMAMLNYMIAKIITAVAVAICFNFFMQKNYVFRFNV